MKKYFNLSLTYGLAAMAAGVFYREFTKFQGFTGRTSLEKVHPHLFVLGVGIFLMLAFVSTNYKIEQEKNFKIFYKIYNVGLPLTAIMMAVRGISQVLELNLSKMSDMAISGIAGIGHIMLGAGLVLLLLSIKKACTDK